MKNGLLQTVLCLYMPVQVTECRMTAIFDSILCRIASG